MSFLEARELLDDPSSSELLMLGPDEWFTTTGGKKRFHEGKHFADDEEMRAWLNTILEECGSAERVDGSSFKIEAAYASGDVTARVHIMCPPVTDRYEVTIAKQGVVRMDMGDLVENETLSEEMAAFLNVAVTGRLNILVAGGTGAGKTTMLNAMASLCDSTDSIVVAQDVHELSLPQKIVRYMHSGAVRSPIKSVPVDRLLGLFTEWAMGEMSNGHDGEPDFHDFVGYVGKHATADLWHSAFYTPVGLDAVVREALRMRPDRIIVGEVRGAECSQMLEAMSAGHPGMATVHARGPREALDKLVMLVLKDQSHPTASYAARLVAQTIDLVVYLPTPENAQHRVGAIMEVVPSVVNETTITHEVLYEFDGAQGFVRRQHPSSRLRERLAARGLVGAL